MRRWLLVVALLVGAAAAAETRVGPQNGTLLIVGGGSMAKLWPVFLELAGGSDAPIVVIPTANESVDANDQSAVTLRSLGATHVTQLHTRDPKIADTEEFTAPLRSARAVWLTGGRQWRLADAYLKTRTLREIFAVLERGGVVGGSSAGASIQASYMVRGSPQGNTLMMAPGHEEGFALLRNSAIDQHVNTRKRADDLRPVLRAHPALLGIALDEATAIVVTGDRCRVVGAGVVRFFATPDAPPFVLGTGARFDLAARHGIAP
ncbi:MAG: peptidase S51 [Opitutus sp.]|nr:peptidase S51 [Opitutus sp.]